MARLKEAEPEAPGWMVTFSDMVTLLLTFFVMIISITTVDPKSLAQDPGDDVLPPDYVEGEKSGPGVFQYANPHLLDPIVEMLDKIEWLPEKMMFDQNEIKAAIFQLDGEKSEEYQRLAREVSDNVSIFKDERGMVIRWDKAILFPEGGAILQENNQILLAALAGFLERLKLPVSVESHTNPLSDLEGGTTVEGFNLSARRSRVVFDYLVLLGLSPERFRLGSFGGARPLTGTGEGENSRMEIIIYKPVKSSWKG